jgi:hypothetical protein
MFAVFILLGLMFGTSLGYLALAALRAAKSTTKDETVPVVAANAPNPPLGNGWEYAFYATREYSSKEPQGPSLSADSGSGREDGTPPNPSAACHSIAASSP